MTGPFPITIYHNPRLAESVSTNLRGFLREGRRPLVLARFISPRGVLKWPIGRASDRLPHRH